MLASTLSATTTTAEPAWLELVRRKVKGLRYGQVYIVVHDHEVTQIECTERTRLPGDSASPPRYASGD